jgi:hypothetical protein
MKLIEWLDVVEITVVAIVAALLLVLGPLATVYRFALNDRHGAALFTGVLWISCIAACVLDCRHRRFSWVSGGVFTLWLVTTLVLGFIVS